MPAERSLVLFAFAPVEGRAVLAGFGCARPASHRGCVCSTSPPGPASPPGPQSGTPGAVEQGFDRRGGPSLPTPWAHAHARQFGFNLSQGGFWAFTQEEGG